MTSTHLPTIAEGPSPPGLVLAARRYLTGWRGIAALGVVVVAVGLALNWSWLVAAGIAPLVISVLPCVAMCALGLCMKRTNGRKCTSDQPSGGDTSARCEQQERHSNVR